MDPNELTHRTTKDFQDPISNSGKLKSLQLERNDACDHGELSLEDHPGFSHSIGIQKSIITFRMKYLVKKIFFHSAHDMAAK